MDALHKYSLNSTILPSIPCVLFCCCLVGFGGFFFQGKNSDNISLYILFFFLTKVFFVACGDWNNY